MLGPALGATEENVRFRTSSQVDEACISKSNRMSKSTTIPPVGSKRPPSPQIPKAFIASSESKSDSVVVLNLRNDQDPKAERPTAHLHGIVMGWVSPSGQCSRHKSDDPLELSFLLSRALPGPQKGSRVCCLVHPEQPTFPFLTLRTCSHFWPCSCPFFFF